MGTAQADLMAVPASAYRSCPLQLVSTVPAAPVRLRCGGPVGTIGSPGAARYRNGAASCRAGRLCRTPSPSLAWGSRGIGRQAECFRGVPARVLKDSLRSLDAPQAKIRHALDPYRGLDRACPKLLDRADSELVTGLESHERRNGVCCDGHLARLVTVRGTRGGKVSDQFGDFFEGPSLNEELMRTNRYRDWDGVRERPFHVGDGAADTDSIDRQVVRDRLTYEELGPVVLWCVRNEMDQPMGRCLLPHSSRIGGSHFAPWIHGAGLPSAVGDSLPRLDATGVQVGRGPPRLGDYALGPAYCRGICIREITRKY